MPNFRKIFYSCVQKVGAFVFSWNALMFCFFCVLSTGIWFIRSYDREAAELQQKAESIGAAETIVYTEKTLTVPVRPTGEPNDEKLVLFPAEVSVTARVTLSEYSNLSAADFAAECSFPEDSEEKLEIRVRCTNDEVASFRYTPQEAEYLIEKNHSEDDSESDF